MPLPRGGEYCLHVKGALGGLFLANAPNFIHNVIFRHAKAPAAITATGTAPARLVFGGGTALGRAHRLIRRMSEDIDFRIVSDSPLTRPALRHLRDAITDALLGLYVIWRYNGRQNGK